MPAPTRAAIKTSIVYLAIGAVLGALMLIDRWVPLGQAVAYFRVPHVHLLIVGWLTQLILGVAWWLFPPLAAGQRGEGRRGQAWRGSEPLFWTTVGLLNAAVVLRSVADPLYTWTRGLVWGLLIGLSGACLVLAALTFVGNMWRRVREVAGHR